MQPKVTIIDGNNEIELSTVEENVKAYMVKGEPGADGVSPSASISKTGDIATITITDKNGTTEADVIDGYNPTISTSRVDRTTTITITDIDGTATTEIYDGIDLTGGVPTNGVIGWDGNELIYTCDGTETGSYYFTYENVNYYFTMPTVEDGDSLIFNTLTSTLTLDGTTITTAATGTGSELTFVDNIPNGYEITNETFPGSGGDYADLTNKPKINGVELYLNQTSASLGIVTNTYIDSTKPSYSARYINNLIEGKNPMGSIVVDDVSCKNMFNPVLYADGQAIVQSNSFVTVSDGEFTFVSSGADMYFGQLCNSGNSYTNDRGILINVENLNKITFTITNTAFNRVYVTAYNSSKVSLGYTVFTNNTGTYTLPTNTKYISIRFGKNDAVSGTTYTTKVQVEAGDTSSSYTPYKTFENKEIYTKGEEEVGTWIDGRPIYRKTVEYTNQSTIGVSGALATVDIPHNISDFDIVIKPPEVVTSTGNIFPILNAAASTTTVQSSVSISFVNTTNIQMRLINQTLASRTFYITLDYVKTSNNSRSLEVEDDNR